MDYAIGVDIGGTKIQFAAVDTEGNIVQRHLIPTEAKLGPQQVIDKVMNGIERIAAAMNSSDVAAGIGVGSAGQIDFHTGEVVFAGETLPGWTGMPIRRHVEERFGKPTFVDNDVNVIAVAEKEFGAGKQFSSFICLALGTGVGGALWNPAGWYAERSEERASLAMFPSISTVLYADAGITGV
nr:ROK family protein [Cohnella kolymensis]